MVGISVPSPTLKNSFAVSMKASLETIQTLLNGKLLAKDCISQDLPQLVFIASKQRIVQNFSIHWWEFCSPAPAEYNLFLKIIARLRIICPDKSNQKHVKIYIKYAEPVEADISLYKGNLIDSGSWKLSYNSRIKCYLMIHGIHRISFWRHFWNNPLKGVLNNVLILCDGEDRTPW